MAATTTGAAARPLRRLPRLQLAERLAALGAGAALLALLARLVYAPYQAVYRGTGADYVAFATGSRLVAAGDRCLYCLPHQADTQAALLGYRPVGAGFPAAFFNAPLAAWVLQPVATLSLGGGLRLFVTCLALATGVSVALARRSLEGLGPRESLVVALAVIATLPGAMGLVLAQWTPLLLAFALGGLLALRGSLPVLAGLLLSVLFIKPQLCLLLLPALLAARSWRLALGVGLGAAAWWGCGFALAGPSFPQDFATLVAHLSREGVTTAGLPSFAGFTPWGAAGVVPLAIISGAACLAVLVAVRARLRGDPEMAVALGIAMSLLAAPHVFGDDLLLLVPALLVLARRCSPVHALLVAGLLDIAYLIDERLLPTAPRALEALCTLLTVLLLVRLTSRERHPQRQSRLDAALAAPQWLLAGLDGRVPSPAA
ncbi:MAG TPA: glycosyltransferase family 87 protein [Candidatus Dormibacteraeota bacterium]